MNLANHLSGLAQNERDVFQQRIDSLSQDTIGYQVVVNIYAESRLNLTAWQMIVGAICQANVDIVDIRGKSTAVFQQLTLQGHVINQPWPALYGRAVSKGRFHSLMKKQGKVSTLSAADVFTSNLIGKSKDVLRRRLGHIYLAEYGMWATFCETSPNSDPFCNTPQAKADDIRASLGLCQNDNDDILLFVYSLPSNVEPQFPTVADAYAGGWNWFFRPAPGTASCGRTMAWLGYAGATPHPEVVHARVSGATLEGQIRLIRK